MVINYSGHKLEKNIQIYFNNKKIKYINIKKNNNYSLNKIYFF